MTITTNDTRNEYTATGGQTVFNYTFKIFDSGDLNVYQTASGATANDATDLITAYTVTGVGNSAGGTVVLDSGATAGDLITIVSAIDDTRTTDYQNNGDFLPDTVNDDIDRAVSLVKQLKNTIDRTPQFEESEQGATGIKWAAPVTGGFLRWNATLDQIENVVLNTAEDATNAAAVSVSDSGGYFTGTDVEACLQEIADGFTFVDPVMNTQNFTLKYTGSGASNEYFLTSATTSVGIFQFSSTTQTTTFTIRHTDNTSTRLECNNKPLIIYQCSDLDMSDVDLISGMPSTAMNANTYFKFPTYANLAAITSAISTPAAGMMVHVTTQGMAVHNGTNWVKVTDYSTPIT